MTRISLRRVAAIGGAGDLGLVEDNRQQSARKRILCRAALVSCRVECASHGHERLALEVKTPRAAVRGLRVRYVDRTGLVVTAECEQAVARISVGAIWSITACRVSARPQARRNIARDQSSVAVEVGSKSATALSARAKSGGRVLPRLAARRRIPEQALALK